MTIDASPATPWQRVYAKFRMPQSDFARAIKRHRSKISRALKDEKGFINGRDQKLLIDAATARGITLDASDLIAGRQ